MMDLQRYLDLYLAETEENLQLLNRRLVELEHAEGPAALEDAFRAAHTIKGMSAAMGFAAAVEQAHFLEDRLQEVRDGRATVDAPLIDALLAAADGIAVAVAGAGGGRSAGPAKLPRPAAAAVSAAPLRASPDGLAVRVMIDPAAPLRSARAVLVLRKLEGVATVLRADPAAPDEDFGGQLDLVLAGDADRAAVEAAIRSAGDVLEVVFALPLAAEPAPREDGGRQARQVRVEARRLDDLANGVGELAIVNGSLRKLAERSDGGDALGRLVDRMGRILQELEDAVMAVRMVPVGEAFDRFPRVVRDAARATGREVEFVVEGTDVELDRAILDELADPLVHLLRNAVDHGIEPPAERRAAGKPPRGRLVLRAVRERSQVLVQVEDDGGGIARERVLERARAERLPQAEGLRLQGLTDDVLLRILSQPGLSTAEAVTEVSGRGVGLDVVATRIRSLGGSLELQTEPGRGTRFSLRLPLTLAVAQALRVRVGGEDYAIPLTHVLEATPLDAPMIARVRGREALRLRSELLPLVRLGTVLRVPQEGREEAAVIVGSGERRFALAVDELVGREQIVIKAFDAAAGALPLFAGATLLADGRPALVLDPMSIL
jgi:two-component system, chemotaxis family, sensor kinase CheA